MHLNHVAIIVSDRVLSARFYGDHFGLVRRVHDDDHLLILGAEDGALLGLTQGDPPVLESRNHFGFQVESPNEVLEARARFAAAGVEEVEFEASGSFLRVQVKDPDGYRVEVYSF